MIQATRETGDEPVSARQERRNVFAVGEDEFHFDPLNAIRDAERYRRLLGHLRIDLDEAETA